MEAKLGAILKGFTIERADGTIERYDKPIHNVMSTWNDSNANIILNNNYMFWNNTNDSWVKPLNTFLFSNVATATNLGNRFSQTGNVITKVGSTNLTRGYGVYVWDSPSLKSQPLIAYNITSNSPVTSVTVNKSLSVADATYDLWFIPNSTINWAVGTLSLTQLNLAPGPFDTREFTYNAGLFKISNKYPIIFRATANISGMKTMEIEWVGVFKLSGSPGINMNIGDRFVIGVGDLVWNYQLDNYAPRAFSGLKDISNNIISGTSGSVQRCLPFYSSASAAHVVENNVSANTIWLINDANKFTLPPDLGLIRYSQTPTNTTATTGNVIANKASPISFIATLTGTATKTDPLVSNNFTRGMEVTHTLTSTYSNVKQIAWGTSSQVFGILEFDNPQTLSSGKTIKVGSKTNINLDFNLDYYR